MDPDEQNARDAILHGHKVRGVKERGTLDVDT
jgi:hypothetical protein